MHRLDPARPSSKEAYWDMEEPVDENSAGEDLRADSPSRTPPSSTSFWQRLHRALGPVAGAMILDLADFATLGPIGIFLGLPVGSSVGWWLAGLYGVSGRARVLVSLLAGGYCLAPLTSLLPVATVLSVICTLLEDPKEPHG